MPKDNQRELFYLVDDEDQVLGSVSRLEAHQSQTIKHRSVFILVFNDKNELLLQKRNQNKDTFPSFWTLSASGHVSYGQSYDEAAKRELREELGLEINLEPLHKTYVSQEREFCFIYQGKFLDDKEIKFDQDEVEKVQWVNKDNLKQFVKENKMTPAAMTVLRELRYL